MRKGLLITLVLVFLAGISFATDVSRLEYSVNLKNDSGSAKTYIIPITTIRPKIDKLVGYSVMPLDSTKNSEVFIGIFDGTDVQLSGECLGEDEADNDSGGIKDHWARGKWIVNGIVARVGVNTDTQLYFVRK